MTRPATSSPRPRSGAAELIAEAGRVLAEQTAAAEAEALEIRTRSRAGGRRVPEPGPGRGRLDDRRGPRGRRRAVRRHERRVPAHGGRSAQSPQPGARGPRCPPAGPAGTAGRAPHREGLVAAASWTMSPHQSSSYADGSPLQRTRPVSRPNKQANASQPASATATWPSSRKSSPRPPAGSQRASRRGPSHEVRRRQRPPQEAEAGAPTAAGRGRAEGEQDARARAVAASRSSSPAFVREPRAEEAVVVAAETPPEGRRGRRGRRARRGGGRGPETTELSKRPPGARARSTRAPSRRERRRRRAEQSWSPSQIEIAEPVAPTRDADAIAEPDVESLARRDPPSRVHHSQARPGTEARPPGRPERAPERAAPELAQARAGRSDPRRMSSGKGLSPRRRDRCQGLRGRRRFPRRR